ncbi:MAG TPA: ankyrin repeat domain-containing protein [Puia sp.]|nr:ankyrin repeat domain-containing protein [Puia sp.]
MNQVVQFIINRDAEGLRRALSNDPSLANAGIPIPGDPHENERLGHPLHRLCDAVFAGLITETEAIDVARVFLEHGADIDGYKARGDINTPLSASAGLNAETLALFYLQQGADFLYVEPKGGSTALHWAAICGLDRLVRELIEKGAEINRRDRTYNATPVDWAAYAMSTDDKASLHHQMDCIRVLLAAGADRALLSEETRRMLSEAAEGDEGLSG